MITDTIYAPATASGRSSVAVVRVSGPLALQSLKKITQNKSFEARRAILVWLKNPENAVAIDRAVVIFFKGPESYTGEDVVEYHLHGGRAVTESLLSVLATQKNHRMAEPGEFTRRAFENGKLDLTEAEAVADLVNAETEAQKIQALSQMEGALSKLYAGWTDILKIKLAHLEADIEFPDEDLPGGIAPKIKPVLKSLESEITAHLQDNRRGERLRDGIHVVVIGAPNAGKSSLVNALMQRDIAIVSDLPGTTRDIIEAHLDIGGYPVILSDTAGLNPLSLKGEVRDEGATHNSIESEGIRRAMKRAAEADLKILLFDSTEEKLDVATRALADESALIVFNKIDKQNLGILESQKFFRDSKIPRFQNSLFISVQTGEGLNELTNALLQKIKTIMKPGETPSLTRARHRKALEETHESLRRVQNAKLPELMAEDMRLAIRALGRITGKVDVEDLLDVIFRDFCIGK